MLDDKLREIVDYCAESYYPEHEYGDSHREQNKEYLEEALEQIKQLYAKEVMPNVEKLTQDMVNLHANMKNDMIRLGFTSTPDKGGEWTIEVPVLRHIQIRATGREKGENHSWASPLLDAKNLPLKLIPMPVQTRPSRETK